MAIVKTEAFVLKSFRYGETSVIVRLLTRDRGVVGVIAKGARRPRSRVGGALGPFRRLAVTYYDKPGRDLQTLVDVDLLTDYGRVAGSLERLDAAGSWFRFLRHAIPEGAPAEPLFRLAAHGLARLEATPTARTSRWETYHRAAAARLLGLAPRIDTCASCGRALPDGGGLSFSVEEGGVLCGACGARSGARPLDGADYGLLQLYHHPDYGLLAVLEEGLAGEARVQDLVRRFVAWHVDVHAGRAGP
jgi:DNA repair protein RecO (recombination protein O)